MGERVRIEIGFDGGQIMGALVEAGVDVSGRPFAATQCDWVGERIGDALVAFADEWAARCGARTLAAPPTV